jgi:hypothetical protein
MQPHEEPVCLFIQGIIVDESLSIADGFDMVAALREERRQALERLEISQAQVLSLCKNPVVIATVKQVASISCDDLTQCLQSAVGGVFPRSGQGIFEGRDIEPVRSVRSPPQRARRDIDVAIGVWESSPQVMKDMPEICARLRLGGIGPEHESQALSRLGSGPVQHEVGEERFRPCGRERRQQTIAVAEVECTK